MVCFLIPRTQQPPEQTKKPETDVSTSTLNRIEVGSDSDITSIVGIRKRNLHDSSSKVESTNINSSSNNKSKLKTRSLQNVKYNEHNSDDSECNSSSDYNTRQSYRSKHVSYNNREKSQIICYRDKDKIIAIKNDSTMTKFNSVERIERIKKYDKDDNKRDARDTIDFNSLRLSKYNNYKPKSKSKHDIISDTVDAWAKNHPKSMFSNWKDSLFGGHHQVAERVTYKPLIFGGTYPIDAPTDLDQLETFDATKAKTTERPQSHRISKTFDIDRPIGYRQT